MISLLIKATVVLGAGWLVALILLRRSAALRHMVWTATLAAAAGLAFMTLALPELRVPVPAISRAESGLGFPGVMNTDPATAANVMPAAEGLPVTTNVVRPRPVLSLTQLAGGLWLAGTLFVLGWCLLGRLGLARLLRRSTPLGDPAWQDDLARQVFTAGLTRPVRLAVSPRIGSPAMWGFRHPVIVLPPSALEWGPERRQVVLAHELAHIARGDGLASLIGWLTSALYWFHPLAWMAARRLRAEAERAADDLALAQGIAPVDYAAHLLEVARGSRVMRLLGATAIGMARPRTLEGRLLAVLDDTRNRLVPRTRTTRTTWILCAGLALPLAALTPVARPVPREERAENRLVAPADSTFEESYPARPGGVLTLDLEIGGSVRIEGWDELTVRIRGELRGVNWRETTVQMWPQSTGLRLRVSANVKRTSFSTSHHFEIRVPRRYDVRLESSGGSLTIVGVEGSFTGQTGGGSLNLERAKGEARLSTGGGEISVVDSELDGRVSTGGGMVRLDRVRGDLKGSSGSGPVIHVGNERNEKGDLGRASYRAAGTLHIEKAGGNIELERAPDGAEVRTGGGEIRIGGGAGMVSARTGGGDITIGPVDGSIEASTGAGTLRVTIVSESGSVRLGTGKGDAIVELPPGYSGRFELESAYTETHPKSRITSDWELTRSETTEWDETRGSPRKYVRASGRIGDGAGVIRIRIVNGDITVRRGS